MSSAQIVENNGGHGLNASTSSDVDAVPLQLPQQPARAVGLSRGRAACRKPVLREFYTEKDGPVTEERRMRTDNNPIGRLIEQFENLMFMANGYHHSTIGYMSDLEQRQPRRLRGVLPTATTWARTWSWPSSAT